jgi:hypothetical protein
LFLLFSFIYFSVSRDPPQFCGANILLINTNTNLRVFGLLLPLLLLNAAVALRFDVLCVIRYPIRC